MLPDTIRRPAAFLRDGIVYGILSPADAVAWADMLIESSDEVPTAIFDLSVAPGKGQTPVLEALSRLTDQSDISEPVARALLDLLHRRVVDGSVPESAALVRAYHLTRALGVDSRIRLEAMVLEENYSMATSGIFGTVADLNREVREWLATFRGSAASFDPH